MIIKKLNLIHANSWRSGPHLSITDDVDDRYEIIYRVEFPVSIERYRVYLLILDDHDFNGNHRLILLRDFDDIGAAILYSKQQYYLYTGNYPFIATGFTAGYSAIGDRVKIPIDRTMKCEIDDTDRVSYLVIIENDHFEAHSLFPDAEW